MGEGPGQSPEQNLPPEPSKTESLTSAETARRQSIEEEIRGGFNKWIEVQNKKDTNIDADGRKRLAELDKKELEAVLAIPTSVQEALLRKPNNMNYLDYGEQLSILGRCIDSGEFMAGGNEKGDAYAITNSGQKPNGHIPELLLHNASLLGSDQVTITATDKNWSIGVHDLKSKETLKTA